MNPLTEARQALVAQLATLPVTVYGAPPETVTPPAVLVMGGDPWTKGVTYGKTEVHLVVTCLATMSGQNAAAMERLEQLTWDVRQLIQDQMLVGDALAPRIVKVGAAEVAAADLPITIHVTDD
jgi:hypothetical protein